MSNYATLGQSCQVNANELISNAKFINLNDPVYDLILTKMDKYPYPTAECGANKEEIQQQEVKVKKGCC